MASEVIIQFKYLYEWKNKFGSGISADLQGVQVIDLVEYRAGDGEELKTCLVVMMMRSSVVRLPRLLLLRPTKDEFDDDLPDVLQPTPLTTIRTRSQYD